MIHPHVLFIAAFGLTDYELRLLRSVLALTKGRSSSYQLSERSDDRKPDIAILDPSNTEARSRYDAIKQAKSGPDPVTLLIGKTDGRSDRQYQVARPFAPSRLLGLLDHISAEIEKTEKLNSVKVSATAHQPAPPKMPESPLFATPVERREHRALVVDDSPTVRIKLQQELRAMQIHSDCAETGEHALEMLKQNHYDLVLLDVVLPGADGYDICKHIKRLPETKRIPVVMLTSKSSPFDRIRGSLSGCTSYLTKPVDILKFHSVIEKTLFEVDLANSTDIEHKMIAAQ